MAWSAHDVRCYISEPDSHEFMSFVRVLSASVVVLDQIIELNVA